MGADQPAGDTAAVAQPTASPDRTPSFSERLPALDLLRGIAILGILPANLIHFLAPQMGLSRPPAAETGWNETLRLITLALVDGKLVTLLSILFGAGLAVQSIKARQAGRPFLLSYLLRLAVLFLLGFLHTTLLWFGDILITYAIVGCFAVLLSLLPALWRKIVIGLALGAVYVVIVVGSIFGGKSAPKPDETAPQANTLAAAATREADQVGNPHVASLLRTAGHFFSEENQVRIFREGGFDEMMLSRLLHQLFYLFTVCVVMTPYLVACFLIGNGLMRRGVFDPRIQSKAFLLWLTICGLAIGLILEVTAVGMVLAGTKHLSLAGALQWFGVLPLALGYLGLGIFWSRSGQMMWMQKVIQAVGRLALTNYLSQSLLMGFFFYGYGLGWFGQASRAQGMGAVAIIWIVQLIVSPIYLRYFKMGPVEWLWRRWAAAPKSFTPIEPPPMVLPAQQTPSSLASDADSQAPRLESDAG